MAAYADARLEARRHFRQGMSLIQKGAFEAGIAELQEAYATKPHPNVLFNIARAYQDWGRTEEAVAYYRRYLSANPPDAPSVRRTVRELEAKLAAAAPKQPDPAAVQASAPPDASSAPAADAATVERLTDLTIRLEAALARAEALSAQADAQQAVQAPTPVEDPERYLLDDSADAPPYEELVVTTARRAQSTLEAPYSTTIITGDEIRLAGATTLVDLLRRVPGAEVMQLGVGSANVSFRGFNQRLANKVVVLIDGRTEYQDFLGLTIWSSLPVGLEEIERIEVVRGPGSALYGANAMLGVINIITRAPGTGPAGRFTLSGGNGNRAAGSFLASGGKGKLRYRASVAYEQADKWTRDFEDGRSDIAGTSFDSSLGFRGARGNLSAVYAFDRDAQLGLSAGVNRLYTEIYPLGLLRNFAFDGLTSYAKGDVDLGPVKVKLFWNHLSAQSQPQYEPRGARSLLTRVSSNVFDGEALFTREFELAGQHQFFAGVSTRFKRVVWDYLDATHAELHAAAFVQDEWRIVEPFRIVASWRVDRHPLLDGGRPGYAQSPRLSAVFMPFEGHALRASAATAFREPTFLESYTEVRVPIPGVPGASALTTGSTSLRPERLVAYELGYRGERVSLGLEWDLALYQNEVKDLIGLSPLSPVAAGDSYDSVSDSFLLGRSRFQNEPAVYTARGAELGVRFSPVDRVDLRLSGALQTVTAQGLPEGAECGPCQQAPGFKLYGGATWRSPVNFDFTVEGAYTSTTTWIEREPGATDPTLIVNKANALPAYTVLNARVGYRALNDKLEVALAGTHLLNPHQEHPFGNRIERRILGTLTVTP